MAINFPSNPGDGAEYTDPNSGTWVYDSGSNSWTLTGSGSASAFNFIGGHDFRGATEPNGSGAGNAKEAGDVWIHDAPDGSINNVYTGLSGQISRGQLVLWDGSNYVMISGTMPGYPNLDDGNGATLDSRYLFLGAGSFDQEVQSTGTTTFNGRGEFGGGVKVTGASGYSTSAGTIGYSGNLELGLNTDNRFVLADGGSTLYNEGVVRGGYGWNNLSIDGVLDSNVGGSVTSSTVRINPTLSANYQTYSGIHFRPDSNALTGTTDTIAAFRADAFTSQTGATTGIGFLSDLITGGPAANNYNFYAEGNAPNYFRGIVRCGHVPTKEAKDVNDGDTNINQTDIQPNLIATVNSNNNIQNANLFLTRTNVSGQDGYFIKCASIPTSGSNWNNRGGLRGDGSGGVSLIQGSSDYRLKENIVDLPSAVNAVKNLRPVTYNYIEYPGTTRSGFIAHELQEQFSEAVFGTKDDTEAIGTVTDYSGTVLETNVIEPEELTYEEQVEATPFIPADPDNGVEEQEATYTTVTRTKTWTPTGTQPVYQSVDQTKLIPLLTKALQEALEKIDTLEQRLSNAGL